MPSNLIYLHRTRLFSIHELLILFLGSDARKFVYSSESDPPLITIPRPNGTRGSSSGKYQSLDGNYYIKKYRSTFGPCAVDR